MKQKKLTLLEALKLSRLDTPPQGDDQREKQPQPEHGGERETGVDHDEQRPDEDQAAEQDAPPPSTQELGQTSDDPDKQGMIRTVKGAHLVYKRQTEEGSFEELWVYKHDQLVNGLKMRKAILAGTDIPTNSLSSEDGSQTYELWSQGNIEMLLIKGLVQ